MAFLIVAYIIAYIYCKFNSYVFILLFEFLQYLYVYSYILFLKYFCLNTQLIYILFSYSFHFLY
nr:MAG TPA: hypothetical protein [Caudoviricetes sp.]